MHFGLKTFSAVVLLCGLASAQGTPPHDPWQHSRQLTTLAGTPPQAPMPRLEQMKNLIKTQVRRAIDGKPYPALREWRPLTEREKFDYFLHSTYAPRTFVNAGVDVIANRVKGHDRNPEYETGLMGLGQHYGIGLATDETDVFFKRFLFPALLHQDPRYFRNPELPFFKRALYSMSRVVITRTDSGGQTFNSSSLLGAAASRVLGDLYVPGSRQGMHPLSGCISYNLLRDAGMNLVHEFWPDFRRKFLHR
jgi:hypothetical protein